MKGVVWFVLLCNIGLVFSCKSGPSPAPLLDWSDVVLYATGVGRLKSSESFAVKDRILAIQAAKIDAYQQLEESILNLKMDGGQIVLEFVGGDPNLHEKVQGFVRGARIIETRVGLNAQMEVDAELFLGENFKAVLGLIERKRTQEGKRMTPQQPRGNFFR